MHYPVIYIHKNLEISTFIWWFSRSNLHWFPKVGNREGRLWLVLGKLWHLDKPGPRWPQHQVDSHRDRGDCKLRESSGTPSKDIYIYGIMCIYIWIYIYIYGAALATPPPPPTNGYGWTVSSGSSGPPPVACGGGMLVCWYVGMLVCWYVCM
jgi:hypothetical protein